MKAELRAGGALSVADSRVAEVIARIDKCTKALEARKIFWTGDVDNGTWIGSSNFVGGSYDSSADRDVFGSSGDYKQSIWDVYQMLSVRAEALTELRKMVAALNNGEAARIASDYEEAIKSVTWANLAESRRVSNNTNDPAAWNLYEPTNTMLAVYKQLVDASVALGLNGASTGEQVANHLYYNSSSGKYAVKAAVA